MTDPQVEENGSESRRRLPDGFYTWRVCNRTGEEKTLTFNVETIDQWPFRGRLGGALTASKRIFDQVVIDFQRVGEDGRMLLQQFGRDRSFRTSQYPAMADCDPDGIHTWPPPRFVRSQHLIDIAGFTEQL